MASGAYKIELMEKIIELCSSEKYALVTDFAWYIDILVILARIKGIDEHGKHSRNLGPLVSNQIIDVMLRVLPVTRPYAIRRMIGLILDGRTCNDKRHFSGTFGLELNGSMMPEVLPVAAFIIGEHSSLIDEAISLEIDGEEEDDELLKL
jgi:AP-3 complex subunit delta-1